MKKYCVLVVCVILCVAVHANSGKADKKKQDTPIFGGAYHGQNSLNLSGVNSGGSRRVSDEWTGTVDFKRLDKMLGYLWAHINGRIVKLENSGAEVSNIFAELQRRCLARSGKPLAFAIRLRDF